MADSNNSFKNKVIRKLKSGTWYPFYNTFYEKVPIDRREILLLPEAGFPWKAIFLRSLQNFPVRNTANSEKSWQFRRAPVNRLRKNSLIITFPWIRLFI